jgi:exodeoxyribonuclease-1
MTYIFYDTETTGKHTSFDQILQFAAIKADDELNIIDTYNIRCRLLPYIVPSPEALLVTGTTISDITTCPLSHFEMMRQVHAKMHRWSEGGAIFIGWNSIRFDETMLRQAYYQSLLPVYQTNTNGNGRADMMRMAQIVSACAPNVLAIPLQEDGKRTFRLGLMAAANDVSLDNAHDALADASATLGIARLIKQRAPALWDALMKNARKGVPLKLLLTEPLLLLSEHYGVSCSYIVAPIVKNATNPNEWGLFDLAFDPASYLDASDDELRVAIDGKTKAIRRTSINAQPRILPVEFAPDDLQGGQQSLETYRARANAIRQRPNFRQRISRLLAGRYEGRVESAHIEERIYSDFASDDDRARMHLFHAHEWSDRVGIVQGIDDRRYREFGRRILATERPELLSTEQRLRWDMWCRKRLCPDAEVPWLTAVGALQQLADLTANADLDQQRQLAGLQSFFKALAAREEPSAVREAN